MGFNLLSLAMSYPLWTLLCAIFFPIVAAIATFVCLRRAKAPRKMLGFFLIIPIFVILIVVFFSDTGNIMTSILASLDLYFPPVVGFLAAIALGIFCLNLNALVCGAGLMKKGGAILNAIATLICLSANIFITYSTWIHYIEYAASEAVRKDGGVFYIKESLPFLADIKFLPEFILESGIEMLALVILAVYLIVYYLSFIALKSPDDIIKEELERRRRAALSNTENKARAEKSQIRNNESDENPRCCAYCEYATILKSDRLKMVCDKHGVVSTSHVCRKFLYDPLKRNASKPLINPLSQSLDDLINEDHI